MCVYDFDYYVEDAGQQPFGADVGPKSCDCGHKPKLGDLVRAWVQIEDESTWDSCPICDGRGLRVVDDYGDETEAERRCWRCDDEGAVPADDPVLDRGYFCAWCDAARGVLDEWCEGMYAWGQIPEQIIEHWDEDPLYRSEPFERLVELARSRWWSGWWPVPVADVEALVAESLAAVKGAS